MLGNVIHSESMIRSFLQKVDSSSLLFDCCGETLKELDGTPGFSNETLHRFVGHARMPEAGVVPSQEKPRFSLNATDSRMGLQDVLDERRAAPRQPPSQRCARSTIPHCSTRSARCARVATGRGGRFGSAAT